jgi:16S rRNA processing protein RimM
VASPAPELVCVAVVATAHGVRGALKLRCFTEDPASVAAYGPVVDRRGRQLTLRVVGSTRDGVIAQAAEITSREQAELLRGTELFVPRARLPQTDEDEFYHEDLVGLDVVDRSGAPRGRVLAVANHGAGDVIEIEADGETVMLPFTREAVPEIDLAARRLVIDPPAEHVWEAV